MTFSSDRDAYSPNSLESNQLGEGRYTSVATAQDGETVSWWPFNLAGLGAGVEARLKSSC